MTSRRLWSRVLDAVAVVLVLAAVVRFVLIPRLAHPPVTTAPPVALERLDGGAPLKLADLHGRLVFVDFFATWCDPCRASIPLVQRYARTHPGAVVLSIDAGEPRELVAPFAKDFAMRDVLLDPDEKVRRAFGVSGFPTMFVVDPRGTIRETLPGYDRDIERTMAAAQARWGTPPRTAQR